MSPFGFASTKLTYEYVDVIFTKALLGTKVQVRSYGEILGENKKGAGCCETSMPCNLVKVLR